MLYYCINSVVLTLTLAADRDSPEARNFSPGKSGIEDGTLQENN